MVRAGRNAKEILIPKISVTGLGDYTRNVGYKTGSITYEYETHSFGYDRAIRLFADVMNEEESGVLDCFVEAGAELQRTQVAPEGDAYTFSQVASIEGVTVKGEDLSEASAVDVLAALRAVTNDVDEKQVSTGSRYLFITPTLRGVLDDFSLANPTRSNRVLERFSRIVEVPQVRFYADGEGVLTAAPTPDPTRELIASGRIYANGKYVELGFTPWDGVTGPSHRQHLTSATFASDMAGFSYLNFNYLFYSCTNLASVGGLGNLSGVRSMRYMFSSCAFTTIDFRGFDPSALTDLFYTFSGCSKLATIYVNATWALLSGGLTGSQCFYSCSTSPSATTAACGPVTRLRTRTSVSTRRARLGTLQRHSLLTSNFAETTSAVPREGQFVSQGHEIMPPSASRWR